jgi:N-acetylmuramoyl-L-alanine amidase
MEAFIPPDAREGWITFVESGDMYELELGHLDPVNEIAGVQGRLRNLGFYAGSVDGRPGKELSDAVLRFQEDAGLPPTGTLSEAGRRKLQEVHGS